MSKEDLRIKFENLPDLDYYCKDDDEFVKSLLIKSMIDYSDYDKIHKVIMELHNTNIKVQDELEGKEFLLFCLLNKALKNNNYNEAKDKS